MSTFQMMGFKFDDEFVNRVDTVSFKMLQV